MRALFGLAAFDGAPAAVPGELEAMGQALAVFGPRTESWTGAGAALGVRQRNGGPWPIRTLPDGTICAAVARLDDPATLARDLGLGPGDEARGSDAGLVQAAWLRWGEACVDRLRGDWALAAWDPGRRRLLGARDHHGNTGMTWHVSRDRCAFATDPRALLALPGTPRRPDLLRVAQMLTAWPGDGIRSFHEGIQILPPGHLLTGGPEGVSLRRWWFPERGAPLPYRRDEDYVEAFLEVYQGAVAARLGGSDPVAATLSGGLDSGSVVALAGPLAIEQGRRLEAFTAVPRLERPGLWPAPVLPNEWRLAQATAGQAGVSVHLPVMPPAGGLLDSVRRQVEIHGAPGHGVANYHWLLPLLELARARGAAALLTGQQGNATVSFAGEPTWFWTSLGSGRPGEAWRALSQAEANPWLALKRQVLRTPLMGPGLAWQRHQALRGEVWLAESALAPDLARRLELGRRMAEGGHDPTFRTWGASLAEHILQPGRNEGGAVWQVLGAQAGLDVRDPTADRAVIEFCLRVPPSQFRQKGQDRWLLRRALRGRLPGDVLATSSRGLQASDLAFRLLEEREAFEVLLDELAGHPVVRDCLDVPKLRRILVHLDPGDPWPSYDEAGCIFLRGISAGLFLRGFP